MTKFFIALLALLTSAVCAQTVPPSSITYSYELPVWKTNSGNNRFNANIGTCFHPYRTGHASAAAARASFAQRAEVCFMNNFSTGLQYKQVRDVSYTSMAEIGIQSFTMSTCIQPHHSWGCLFTSQSIEATTYYSVSLTFTISASAICPEGFSNPQYVDGAWKCSPGRCPSEGTPDTLGRLTTISSITETGWIVPAGSMPNPQCKNKCRVQHPGGSLQCTGYYPINGLVVGGPVYSSCSAEVTHTGTPCNYGGAGGIETLPEWSDRPETFTQTEGNDDGGDGGSDSEILSAIRENTEQAGTTLGTIARNQSTSEDNAEYRNNLLLDKLDELLGKLTSIDTKTGGGGGGGGNSGENGTGTTTGGESVGQVNLDIDAPSGGLKSPGETNAGFQKLLSGTGITRAAGTCPTWTFDIRFLNVAPVMDTHCALWSQNAAVFESLMLAVWTLGALFLVLSA
jgi:hypothetical protein